MASKFALRDEVPSLEELVVSGELGTVVRTTSHPLFLAPFPCRVREASLMAWYGRVPASDRRFWTVKLWRVRAGSMAEIAVKTTRATHGEAVRARRAWDFDEVRFGPARQLDKGDAVAFAFFRTGLAPPLRRLLGMVRYEPRQTVRPWPAPPGERTIHVIGDVHVGLISRSRLNLVLDDLADALVPRPALHLQIGDITHHGRHTEDVAARRWLRALPGPSRTIMGNHDILNNLRSPAAWAQVYGNPGKNFALDLGFVRILAVAPNRDRPGHHSGVLSPATLSWLDRQLAAAHTDCWIASHWPLHRTVLGNPKRVFTSLEPFFYAKPDAEIRAILGRRRAATAWISGHTHSPLDAPHLVRRIEVGGRGFACVNASAIAWVGRPGHWTDPVATLYVTHLAGAIRVRFRDHGAGVWTNASHERLVTIAVGRS